MSFWDIPLNDTKLYYPRRPVCAVFQWHFPAGTARMKRLAILKRFPDVMWWDLERWRFGRLRVWQRGE